MPIGIVTDEQLQQELERISGPLSRKVPEVIRTPQAEVVTPNTPGRKEGDRNVPDSLRKIIGETAVIDGRQEAIGLASMFGISPQSVSAYAKGATSTASYDTPKESIRNHINKSRARSVKRASRVLNEALQSITPEKLADVKPRDLAGIAKDMSAIISNLEPDTGREDAEKIPQFVVFAPAFINENRFERMKVDE